MNPTTPFDLDKDEKKSMEDILKMADDDSTQFSKGSLIQATVIQSDKDHVYLDIGQKQEGQCLRSDFKEAPASGSEIQVVVVHNSADGPVQLSKKEADRRVSWEHIKESFEASVQLTGEVTKSVNHGFIVEVGGVELFLPLSQSVSRAVRQPRFSIGESIDFKILELKERHRSAVVSHKAVIEQRNDVSWAELLEKFEIGDETEGVVTKVVSFGVFIRVDGIEGLLHQSDLSWKKFARFKGRFKPNDEIHVKILAMDKDNNRLSLGLKQLSEDPWEWAKRELGEGDIIRGTVTSITDYGAFIELMEGLEGLVHISEFSWSKRTRHPKKYLQKGQEVEAKVLSLDFESKRIALGLRQLQDDPWDSIHTEINPGDVREGKVTSITKFGAFVEIKDDVEGLIHFNDYTWDDKVDRKLLTRGEDVNFKVLDINQHERRISCGIKQLTPSPYELLRQKYKNGDVLDCTIKSITDFGLFAELEPGFEGLVHISNIHLKQGEKLEDRFKSGEPIKAVLQKIDVDAKKIGLSIKAFEKKQEREIISQYIKDEEGPSTSSMAAFFKKDGSSEE